jgi:hypothetical protein
MSGHSAEDGSWPNADDRAEELSRPRARALEPREYEASGCRGTLKKAIVMAKVALFNENGFGGRKDAAGENGCGGASPQREG